MAWSIRRSHEARSSKCHHGQAALVHARFTSYDTGSLKTPILGKFLQINCRNIYFDCLKTLVKNFLDPGKHIPLFMMQKSLHGTNA